MDDGYPEAPFGATSATMDVCVYPVLSVARAWIMWLPGVGLAHCHVHCRQVSRSGTAARVASFHGPLSIWTSTAAIPLCCAHATPATVTVPGPTVAPLDGTSIRDSVLIGACCDQPFCTQ